MSKINWHYTEGAETAEKLVTMKEVGRHFNFSRDFMRSLLSHHKDLPRVSLNNRIYFKISLVEKWLAGRWNTNIESEEV